MPSITHKAIQVSSSGAISALLIPVGFKRQAFHFWRLTDGLYQGIYFQAVSWGTQDEGSFTVNLSLSAPSLYFAFTGSSFPKNPATALWPVNLRIGHLMPGACDHWWPVTLSTDLQVLGNSVADSIGEYVLPYFEQMNGLAKLKAALQEGDIPGVLRSQRGLASAVLASDFGDPYTAQTILIEELNRFRAKPFEGAVRAVAKRLGIPLNGA